MDVLVIDVGGSNVKMCVSGAEPRRFRSGPALTPERFIRGVERHAAGWRYDAISLGFPGVVGHDGPEAEPGNLGTGWIGFDFHRALGVPVRLVNDAVMQALGAYDGGRMLFLGLGTGLGSALVTEHVIVPLELGELPFGSGDTMVDRVGRRALDARGREQWTEDVGVMSRLLQRAFAADYLVLGGGNARKLLAVPPGARVGGNEDAIAGGFRLWEEIVEPHAREPHRVWRVVR